MRILYLLQLSLIQLRLLSYVSTAAPDRLDKDFMMTCKMTNFAAPQLGPSVTGMTAINSTCVQLSWSAPQFPNRLLGYRVGGNIYAAHS